MVGLTPCNPIMHVWSVLIYAASLIHCANFPIFHDQINTNLLRFYQKSDLPLAQDASGDARNSKDIPIELYVSVAEYCDHATLLSFSATCKLYRLAAAKLISNKLTNLNQFYPFPSDQLNKAMHAVLLNGNFFKSAANQLERIKMLINSFDRYRIRLPHMPQSVYNHLVIFVTALNLANLETFELINFINMIIDSDLRHSTHDLDRILLIRALIDHKNVAVDCFFSLEFLNDIDLSNFNQILLRRIPSKSAKKLLKGLASSCYNQRYHKSFSSVMTQYKSSRIFLPTIETFFTLLLDKFKYFVNSRSQTSILSILMSALLTPENGHVLARLHQIFQ